MRDIENVFTTDGIVSRPQRLWMVPVHHLLKVAIAKADTFDLIATQFARAVRHLEATFRGAMDQVCRGA